MGKKKKSEPFLMLPKRVFVSPAFRGLDGNSALLLFHLIGIHDGQNNGVLNFSERWVKAALNTKSSDTAYRKSKALLESGLVVETRWSRERVERLVALTWLPRGRAVNPKELDQATWTWRPESGRQGEPTGSPVGRKKRKIAEPKIGELRSENRSVTTPDAPQKPRKPEATARNTLRFSETYIHLPPADLQSGMTCGAS